MSFIERYKEKVSILCGEHLVDKLYLFGSAAENSLNESSDIDLVVKFKNVELKNYFKNYMSFKRKLQNLFHREVDLIEEQTVLNPFFKESVESSKLLIYG
jgi:predicted nucleotidyltransferase